MASKARHSWFDETGEHPVIEQAVQQMTTFIDTMADGVVTDDELHAQEGRLIAKMKEVEALLNDAQHAKVTELLCELTAYDMMQALNGMQKERVRTTFRG